MKKRILYIIFLAVFSLSPFTSNAVEKICECRGRKIDSVDSLALKAKSYLSPEKSCCCKNNASACNIEKNKTVKHRDTFFAERNRTSQLKINSENSLAQRNFLLKNLFIRAGPPNFMYLIRQPGPIYLQNLTLLL